MDWWWYWSLGRVSIRWRCLQHLLGVFPILQGFRLAEEIQKKVDLAFSLKVLPLESIDILQHMFDFVCVIQLPIVDFPLQYQIKELQQLTL